MAKRYHDNARHKEGHMKDHHSAHMGNHSPSHAVPHADATHKMMRHLEQYAGPEESKRMMSRDSSMIKEAWANPCLLPEGVIDRDWPRAKSYVNYQVPDLFSGVQAQLHEDERDFREEFNPSKQ